MASETPGYCLFAIQWWPFCMDKSAWATWAQAVLSALSIFAAARIAQNQHHNEVKRARKDQLEAELRRYNALRQLLTRADDISERFLKCIETEISKSGDASWQIIWVSIDVSRAEMQSCDDAFTRIDPLLFDRASVTEAVFACSETARLFLLLIDRPKRPGSKPDIISELHYSAIEFCADFKWAIDTIHTAIDELKQEIQRA